MITPNLLSIIPPDSKPLNVSIRLPDDLNERKNLIKITGDNPKFNSEPSHFGMEIKKEKLEDNGGVVKLERELKDELKEPLKTELIIPVPKVRRYI